MKDNKTYSVYCHTCPDGMQYFGMSKNIESRWKPSGYKASKQFYDAIIKFGWKNIRHEILFSGLTRDEALKLEEGLIVSGWSNGTCLNTNHSGHYKQSDQFRKENNAYKKAWKKAHKEEEKVRNKAYRDAHKEERKAYYESRKDEIKAIKNAWYKANREKWNAYQREYQKRKKLEKQQNEKDINNNSNTHNNSVRKLF